MFKNVDCYIYICVCVLKYVKLLWRLKGMDCYMYDKMSHGWYDSIYDMYDKWSKGKDVDHVTCLNVHYIRLKKNCQLFILATKITGM